MSDSDSFIAEVSEEVRRDRLFGLFRKWAWLAALIILTLVGGAAYFEWQRAQEENASQAFGDALLVALDGTDPADRSAALEQVIPESVGAEMLLALLQAGQDSAAGAPEEAAERLRAVAARSDMPERYRDMAELKAHILAPAETAEARAMLDRLARPGAPYRSLAVEQLAYLEISEGNTEAGLGLLEDLQSEVDTLPGQRLRIAEAMRALTTGSVLVDAPFEPAAAETPRDDLLTLPPANFGAEDTDTDAAPDAADNN